MQINIDLREEKIQNTEPKIGKSTPIYPWATIERVESGGIPERSPDYVLLLDHAKIEIILTKQQLELIVKAAKEEG
jgi:hypothetical protein